MKWFKHDTDAIRNRKIRKVIRTHGVTGYGIWWAILERIYLEEDGFQVCADELWLEDLAEDLKISDHRTLIRVIDTFAEVGLISSQLWAENVIYVEAIAQRGDAYIDRRVYEKEKKRRQREKIKPIPDMSLGDKIGTKGQTPILSPADLDQDLELEPEKNLNTEKYIHLSDKSDVQPVLPISQSGAKEKTTPSAHDFWEEVRRVYNQYKPAAWQSRIKPFHDDQKKTAYPFFKKHGRKEGLAIFEKALRWIAQDKKFWGAEDKTDMNFNTIFREKFKRLYEWSDSWDVLQIKSSASGNQDVPKLPPLSPTLQELFNEFVAMSETRGDGTPVYTAVANGIAIYQMDGTGRRQQITEENMRDEIRLMKLYEEERLARRAS